MPADDFLADLEAAADGGEKARQWYEVAESVRVENSKVSLSERARGAMGETITAYVNGTPVRGVIIDVGPHWLAIDTEASALAPTASDLVRRGVYLVNWPAIEALSVNHARFIQDDESGIGRTWNALFRACAAARTSVVWHGRSGRTYTGLVKGVGKDHVILTSRGAHMALATENLAMLEPFVARPERSDFQKSSRMRPA